MLCASQLLIDLQVNSHLVVKNKTSESCFIGLCRLIISGIYIFSCQSGSRLWMWHLARCAWWNICWSGGVLIHDIVRFIMVITYNNYKPMPSQGWLEQKMLQWLSRGRNQLKLKWNSLENAAVRPNCQKQSQRQPYCNGSTHAIHCQQSQQNSSSDTYGRSKRSSRIGKTAKDSNPKKGQEALTHRW